MARGVVLLGVVSAGQWWLVILGSGAGGLVYVLSARRWLRAYRNESARLGPGESVLWLALLVAWPSRPWSCWSSTAEKVTGGRPRGPTAADSAPDEPSGRGAAVDLQLRQVGELTAVAEPVGAVGREVRHLVAQDRELDVLHPGSALRGRHGVELALVGRGELAAGRDGPRDVVGRRLDLVLAGRGAARVPARRRRVDAEGRDVDLVAEVDGEELGHEGVGGPSLLAARGAAPTGGERVVERLGRATAEVRVVRAVEVQDLRAPADSRPIAPD